MSLVPSVTELILAELLYLQFEDASKPIYMYINSTGTTKDGKKLVRWSRACQACLPSLA
jgi:ATP-dependent Clp protease protease subunit